MPLRYVALLNQSDTNPPTAFVGENTLGSTLTFTYDDVGSYYIIGYPFPEKTFCLISNGNLAQLDSGVGCMRTEDGSVLINTAVQGDQSNGVLRNASLEILVYL